MGDEGRLNGENTEKIKKWTQIITLSVQQSINFFSNHWKNAWQEDGGGALFSPDRRTRSQNTSIVGHVKNLGNPIHIPWTRISDD